MKKILPILFLVMTVCYFSSCEKDDICVEGDTPLLIIGFFDASASDTVTRKSVTNLLVAETLSNSAFNAITSTDSISFTMRIDGYRCGNPRANRHY